MSYITIETNAFDADTKQIVLSLVFVSGAIFEFWVARQPFFVLPPAGFAVYCFIFHVLGGLSYFAFDQKSVSQFYVTDESALWGGLYTIVAVNTLWVAFYAARGLHIPGLQRFRIVNVSLSAIALLSLVGVLSFILSVAVGAYGYGSTNDELDAYLRFGVKLGLLSIVLTIIFWNRSPLFRPMLITLLVINIVIGLAWGSKSTALMPVVLAIVTFYFTRQRVQPTYWLLAFLTLTIAYVVVEPFRVYYEAMGRNVDLSSPAKLLDAFQRGREFSSGMQENYVQSFLDRNNYVVPLAKTLEFADGYNLYRTEEWSDLLLSPLYAVVPRFLWQSKPLADFGQWASVNIFGLPATTSTGITPQGYAYLVARLPGILFFFSIAGVIQRVIFNSLYLNASLVAFYIIMYAEVCYPAVVPWTYVSGTIKSLVLIIPVAALLSMLSRGKKHAGASAS